MIVLKLNGYLVVVLLLHLVIKCNGRIVLPSVPDVLYPPVPDGTTPGNEDNVMDEDDPELSPGLFQGDMALDNVMHSYWKVGLRLVMFIVIVIISI